MKCIALLSFVSLLAFRLQAADTNPLRLDKTISLTNVEGRIDHMAVDVARQRLFVAALGNNSVEVVDLKAGKQTQSLPGFAEPQGIAYASKSDWIFVANGTDGMCRILDGVSLKTVRTVNLGGDADNVRYDKQANRIYVGYGAGALAVLDAKTGAKVADIKLAAHPESFRLETGGKRAFVNVPKADQIAVVDLENGATAETWPLQEAKANFPMILDEANHRLFVGCRSRAAVLVYDSSKSPGRLVATIAISRDTDDLFYDAPNKLVYVSCGGGTVEVIKQNDADNYERTMTIPTADGARTSLFVPELKVLCVAVPHRGSQAAEIRVYRTE
jgi:DNA-binding beta-propeller fold protein YncE